jgi:hypothetical protein
MVVPRRRSAITQGWNAQRDSKCSCLVDLYVDAAAIVVEGEGRKEEYLQSRKPQLNMVHDSSDCRVHSLEHRYQLQSWYKGYVEEKNLTLILPFSDSSYQDSNR